ncbi:hypothetical protein ACH5RR_029106 [Cinchona calisaya]|uniref:Glutamate receptor n=1 Tax=Cinchona calisaya TaxID=153742 RepID=A0ABD2YQP9_9GENT
MRIIVGIAVIFLMLVLLSTSVECQRPCVVNVGAVFSFKSVIGRVAKAAMEIAVLDINADSTILNGTQLKLIMEDAKCNVFLGSIRAFQVLDNEVVAIIGPQSSSIAHTISQIANGLHVPIISYAATDPTLSALQFPYFLRSTHSDSYQMDAMADLIDFYGWKEVIAIYIDNDYGRNAISVLGDELAKNMAKISYKLALPSEFDVNTVTELLNKSKNLGPRVYVVHINPDPLLRFFRIAHKVNMMTSNYVWLATDWLSCTIDSLSKENQDLLSILEGVIVLRPYTPETTMKKAFESRWSKLQQKDLVHSRLNVYGLYAYDTVWAVARSIDKLLQVDANFSFSSSNILQDPKTDSMQLGKFKVFNGGKLLLKILSEINFTGLTGQVRFNADRNIIVTGYEVVNIVPMGNHTVSYWSNYSGFSLFPPESGKKNHIKIDNVTWPGGMTQTPRGWVIANGGRAFRIGIPKRASFKEFVTELNNSHNVQGYCIDLFNEAKKLIPYYIPFTFVPFGNGLFNPNYDDLVKMVANGVFDAAVGDIAIVTNRTRIVDFTQPFAATGLVIVAPIDKSKADSWVFLKPFELKLWAVIAVFFVIIAVVIWILEHRVNDEFRGSPKRQLITMFLFSFSTLFKTNRKYSIAVKEENTVSPLSRMVMVVWLFLLMVITSSYTASLTSILTVQQLSSPITGIDSLIASDWSIGYQVGSFAYSYLSDNLQIQRSRLVALGSPEEYEKALRQGPKNGGVAAIVDELPYIELFLSKRTDFGIVGQPFTKGGWGFAFQKDSPLAMDMSSAILKLAENGKLQEIHQNWFCKNKTVCPAARRKKADPNQLHISSFWELYLVCGVFSLAAILLFLFRVARQYVRYKRKQIETSTPSTSLSSNTHCSQVIYSFFDFIDEKEEAVKRYFNQHNNSQSHAS